MLASKRCTGSRGAWCATHAIVHSFSMASPLSLRERCAGLLCQRPRLDDREAHEPARGCVRPGPCLDGSSHGLSDPWNRQPQREQNECGRQTERQPVR